MLIGQSEFDRALIEARSLLAKPKAGGRILSRKFRTISNDDISLREYAKTLLLAFLSRPLRIRLYRNSGNYRKISHLYCRFVFDLEPFIYEYCDDRLFLNVNEDDLLKPIALRDYLSRRFYCNVEFSALQFGCLEVEYFVSELPIGWIELLENDDDFVSVKDQLCIVRFSSSRSLGG